MKGKTGAAAAIGWEAAQNGEGLGGQCLSGSEEMDLGWDLEVVKHWWTGVRWVWVPEGQEPPALDIPAGFQVLPRRWVVERTLAWLCRNRRLSKDYEALPETEEAFLYVGMIRLMLRRLANAS
jgi:hypothetical protein